jgi:DNA-binding NtrC family response regulator
MGDLLMESLSGIEGTKILLIDDDPSVRESMTQFLSDKGIELTSCETLCEGLEALKGGCYDILMCDQYLLKDDPENTFEHIKNTVPPMSRMLFTGAVGVDARTEAKMEGTDAFIPKPFSAETITDALSGYLRSRSKETQPVGLNRADEHIRLG